MCFARKEKSQICNIKLKDLELLRLIVAIERIYVVED